MAGWNASDRKSRLPADWAQRRLRVLERDGWICQIGYTDVCTLRATDCDHITASGPDDDWNLQAACQPCHLAKTARERPASRGLGRHPGEPHPGAIT